MLLGAEAVRQELGQGALLIALDIHHVNEEFVAAEFPHHLAADPAGRKNTGDHTVLAAADSDGNKIPVAVVHRLEERGALGAVGWAVGGVFDVAALVNGAVGAQQCRPDLVAGIGHIGVGHSLLCQVA